MLRIVCHHVEEIPGVRRQMESNHIRPQHPCEDFFPPRQLPEQIGGGKRNMQEKPNGQIGSQLPKHAGHELQLIILHPHGGIGGGNLGRGFRKLPIHPLVGVPPIAVIPGGHNQIMVQRPQGGISEPLVKLLIVRLGKTHRVEQNPRLGAERFGGLRGGAGPTNPTTMMLRQHRG